MRLAATPRRTGCRRRSRRCAGSTAASSCPGPGRRPQHGWPRGVERRALPSASCARYQPIQPVRTSSTSPGSTVGTLRFERRRDVVGLDRVGELVGDRTPLRLAPPRDVGEHAASGDALPRPEVDAVFLVRNAVVEAVDGMLDVAEAVPLRGRLRVPAGHVLVVSGFVLQPHDSWVNASRPNSGGSGSSMSKLSGNTAPFLTHAAPRLTRSGVRRFSVPSVSRRPRVPRTTGGRPSAVNSSTTEASS